MAEVPSQLGLHVEDLTPDIAKKLGMSKVTGVVVTMVDPASFGEDVDFARGDVITEINHVPVSSMADYKAQLGEAQAGRRCAVPRGAARRWGPSADAVPGGSGTEGIVGF